MLKITVAVLLCLCLCGCSMGQITPSYPKLVTKITITETRDEMAVTHLYTNAQKMESILNYLRLLDPYPPVNISPDTFRADFYEITLHLSDNTKTVYRQLHDQYLQMNNGSWNRINSSTGSQLPDLLSFLSTDSNSETGVAFTPELAYNGR